MAMTVFFVLNALGVIFLLYVLAKFWKEGHRPKNTVRRHAAEFERQGSADVIVVTHPISHCAQGGVSVISFQPRSQGLRDQPVRQATSGKTLELPMRLISTRQGM